MYDVISDVHSCADEFLLLIQKLGYETRGSIETIFPTVRHPQGRRLIIAGDHVDRGPKPIQTLAILEALVRDGHIVIQGGHDEGLREYIEEKPDWDYTKKKLHRHATIQALKGSSEEYLNGVAEFIRAMPVYFETEDLIVVHASYRPELEGEEWVRACLHGSRDGWSTAEDWKREYMGSKTVIHGHRNMKEVKITEKPWGAKIVGIDTGCSYGGKLTCYRHPEGEIVQVQAQREYYPIPEHYWWP